MLRSGGQTWIRRRASKVVEVANIRATVEGPVSRVCAEVDGEPLWFESGDAPLWPAPEAFGCAVLPVAVEHKADPVLGAPLDAIWNIHAKVIQDMSSTRPLRVCDVSTYPLPYFLETVRSAHEVHTDRLHVMLVAAMLGKPTFAYGTCFRKLEAIYEHSVKSWAHVEFINDV